MGFKTVSLSEYDQKLLKSIQGKLMDDEGPVSCAAVVRRALKVLAKIYKINLEVVDGGG